MLVFRGGGVRKSKVLVKFCQNTLPQSNIAPERVKVEDDFPVKMASFQRSQTCFFPFRVRGKDGSCTTGGFFAITPVILRILGF